MLPSIILANLHMGIIKTTSTNTCYEKTTPVVPVHPVSPPSVPASTPPPVVNPTPVSNPAPTPVQSSQATGGTQIWCSGPTAPGWRVDLPGGGCATTSALVAPQVIHLNQLPYTGAPLFDTPLIAYVLASFITAGVVTYIRELRRTM